jgi:hypothetical protein
MTKPNGWTGGYTPGPWRVERKEHPVIIAHYELVIGDYHVPLFPYTNDGFGYYTDDRKIADAHIMAAAPDLYEQLKHLYRGYVNLLETARDKIVELGGPCDRLEELEAADPYLAKARASLSAAEGGV